MALLAGAGPLAGQVAGVPIAAGGVPRGLTLEGQLVFPRREAVERVAGAASIGSGRLGATATVVDGPGDGLDYGLLAEAVLARRPTSPFQLLAFAGLGRATAAGNPLREWRVPLGASLAFRVPLPFLTIVPWLSARAEYVHVRQTGFDDDLVGDDVIPAWGGGLDLRLDRGLGLRAAYDVRSLDGPDDRTFGLGLSWTLDLGL